ncbi:LysR family transcriptional regulator [Paraburkholderia lycopersici]|uniref:DNA-binding transcriptional regulator, LysR family n=1 Tax=Paraburkholderia lycopersici TaxID=416944 RepID=A0A1G6W100_9BURK|nr:LysR family transcriptional regulator [Paraburkholderia lycopersici]SDD58907.1 DNA-binding transcriptional regulator, LysR family [Paraburkholderia lycopersici]
MQLEDVRIFVATVNAGSFTAAADQLQQSKQYVSRRMASLEETLGVRLLVRNTRKLTVTDLGREFYDHAQRILEAVSNAEEAISERHGVLHGALRISAPLSFGTRHLSPLIIEFMKLHPRVQLNVELSDRRSDLIGEGFDLALRIGPLADSTLIAASLGDLPMTACCSPAYAKRYGVPASPGDLARHTCLLYGKEGTTGWEFVIDGNRQMCDVKGMLVANNGELVRDAAVADSGIALLPYFIVGPAIEDGKLIPVLESFAPPPLRLSAVYPQHRQGSLAMRTFLSFLQERLAGTVVRPRVQRVRHD